MLVAGGGGRDKLLVAHLESPVVTELVELVAGSGRFEQAEPSGPSAMAVVIELRKPGRITYEWWFAEAGDEPTEQSKADVRRDLGGGEVGEQ